MKSFQFTVEVCVVLEAAAFSPGELQTAKSRIACVTLFRMLRLQRRRAASHHAQTEGGVRLQELRMKDQQ
ncbi:hypothetical protein EYF80_033850 [Liparis tanakae]|uniref:Uncharacterized protein n=1 Tax=Liparis tanakae TaxID=230148 RepID=A0A4Z2GTI7_9TELE|nr:hypothetical protein EYF80_033850 [Liparis tanakae]